jgi:hypothetical protein
MKKLFLATIILVAIFCLFSVTFAITEQERQALIAQIQIQITQLTQQLNEMLARQQGGNTTWCHTFNTNMSKGDTGQEVLALQVALQKEGFDISASEIQNNQYGDYVTQAVSAFQEKYASDILYPLGLTQGTGKAATATRNKLNKLYGCNNDNASDCIILWLCAPWGSCLNNSQTRSCYDANYCGVTTGRPDQTRSCVATCVPNWQCASWTNCLNNSQTRSCYDANYCGATTGQPAITQSCTLNSVSQNCNAACVTQIEGVYSVNCYGNITKCRQGEVCQNIYNTTYSYNNGAVQTTKTLTGTECTTTATATNNNCTPNWQCSNWSACVNKQQNRTCTDINNCGVIIGKPDLMQSCSLPPAAVDLKINNSDGPAVSPFYTVPYNSTIPLVLKWSSTSVISCSASATLADSAWSGNQLTSGNKTLGKIASSNTYTIICKDSAGNTVTDKVFINISRPSVYLKVNGLDDSIYLDYGTNFTLAWTATNVDSCLSSSTINDGTWSGNKLQSISGSFSSAGVVEPMNTYTITCKDSAGNTASDSVIVRNCTPTTTGANGYYNDQYGIFKNSCANDGKRLIKYTCDSGKVVMRYFTCQNSCVYIAREAGYACDGGY